MEFEKCNRYKLFVGKLFSLKLPFDKKELKISHIDKKDNIFYFCGNNLNDNQIENA